VSPVGAAGIEPWVIVWVNVAVTGLIGLALLALGQWGRCRTAALVPADLPAADRDRRARTLRRGALACQATGVLFLALAALSSVM
jgi:hypothetical protein